MGGVENRQTGRFAVQGIQSARRKIDDRLAPGIRRQAQIAEELVAKLRGDFVGDLIYCLMVKTLEQAIAEVERLPAEDQEQIGRTLLSHVEKLRALRTEIDKGIRSLDAGQGRESSIDEFLRQKNV